MTEDVIIFFLPLGSSDRELEFTLNFFLEEIVDYDIVSRSIKLIANVDDLELALHTLLVVQ